MPKKHRNIYQPKPQSTAHPSLSTTKNEVSRNAAPSSVNDLLSNLRQANGSQANRTPLVHPPTMPPAVRQLLQLPDTPAPLPRVPRRIDTNGHRLPAGPAPPSSWLAPSKSASKVGRNRGRMHPENVMHLPGTTMPREKSLLHMTLKRMAESWEFVAHYNTYYLAIMPTHLRVLLLSYVAVYGPDEGVDIDGFNNIIRPPSGANAEGHFTGNDNFRRLDLSCAMRKITFSQLSQSIIPHQDESLEEDWEVDATSTIRSNPTTFLPFLTHLSLSHPPPSISWPKLLNFAKNVPTITHLSLAEWPVPSLTPNSTTSTMNTPCGSVQYGGTNYYSHSLDNDWSEAAGILRRLSWALYNLEWLNLDGCIEWAPALQWTKDGLNWKEHWRKIHFISLKSSYDLDESEQSERGIPVSRQNPLSIQDFVSYKKAILAAVAVETHIRKERGWITVDHDDWERYDDYLTHPDSSLAAKLQEFKWEEMMQAVRFSRNGDEESAGTSPRAGGSSTAFWQ